MRVMMRAATAMAGTVCECYGSAGARTIASVTVNTPYGAIYTLYDDGQHNDDGPNDGRFANHVWDIIPAPTTGDYVFNATDNASNTGTISDALSNVIDFPRNITPANNSFTADAQPTFTWDAVTGVNLLSGNRHNGINDIWSQGNITDTSVLYNNDMTGPDLEDGNTYYCI